MFIMVIMVFANVCLRFFGSGFVATEELSRILLGGLIFTGAVVALAQGRHIAMPLVIERLPLGLRRLVVLAGGLLMLYCDWLLVAGAWAQVEINLGSDYPLTGLPQSIPYVTGTIAGVLLALVTLYKLGRMLMGRTAPERCFAADDEPATAANGDENRLEKQARGFES
ncbi:TRAP transporter small permease [Salinicola rhizosphaerae]|uniref:TRAP transporter small permease protein n=1 Tax=Salinicola rhizosphaerae TaxID=1443141 RepID=A0ABQ3E2V3_9GAMM|nr:TRAP transporter small permease [Salinicola rhizosphaerae]GHB21519.1 hypothetical protein GCM10009038_20470 [Salinicola rhizosphaerae]